VRPDRLELFLPLPGKLVVVIIFGLLFIQTSQSSTPHTRLPEIDVLTSKPIHFLHNQAVSFCAVRSG
jgi:hypothetical protein